MKRLLYCILNSTNILEDGPLIGVGDQRIVFLNGSGLFAAVSRFDGLETPFDVNSMITYHKVIETLFRQTAIIPFRFKTFLNSEEEILTMLKDKDAHYKKLLSTLDGVVELGIRLVIAKPVHDNNPLHTCVFTPPADSLNPGMLYLKSRKAFYSTASWIQDQTKEFSDLCVSRFEGLFIKLKSEATSLPEIQNRKNLSLISIYFLVKKDLIQEFTIKFREIRSLVTGRMLLSGPWPPYNFVVS
jgi:hypothetical protein